jgi:hypothetical protein
LIWLKLSRSLSCSIMLMATQAKTMEEKIEAGKRENADWA